MTIASVANRFPAKQIVPAMLHPSVLWLPARSFCIRVRQKSPVFMELSGGCYPTLIKFPWFIATFIIISSVLWGHPGWAAY